MNEYQRMIALMARETPERFRHLIHNAKIEVVAHVLTDADESGQNLNPESMEALEATLSEAATFREALVSWKELTSEERNEVANLLEQAGWPDARDDLRYDLDMLLPW